MINRHIVCEIVKRVAKEGNNGSRSNNATKKIDSIIVELKKLDIEFDYLFDFLDEYEKKEGTNYDLRNTIDASRNFIRDSKEALISSKKKILGII